MAKTKNDNEYLNNLRHTAAHLLAKSVKELYPGAKNAIGPAIENGFYQDFDMGNHKISETDLAKIEERMHQNLSSWTHFEFNEVTLEEAKKLFADNPYKIELAEEFAAGGKKLLTNNPGNFLDLCKMGHCKNPAEELQNFKLLKIAGAYWRGNEKNKMLTRIYGTAWPTNEELESYLKSIEEAERRDHRKLGQELDLFSTNHLTGPGLILWHPKLAITREIVENFWKEEHRRNGYQLVYTPHIASVDMFTISRHLTKYINSMFPIMMHEYIEGESATDYDHDEVLKPMNCPNHIQIYKFKQRSYRDLPIRMGELGTVYRYERAGVLHGMTRVRGFTQDDTHIFCRPDQVVDEIKGVIRLTKHIYGIFGFKDYQAYIATRPEKYLGSVKMWDFAENALKQAAQDEGISYKIDEGEGVFYGPKIDSKVKDSLGREWQLGTIQFDFNQPTRGESTEQDINEFWSLKAFKTRFKSRENVANYLKKLGRGFDVKFINDQGKEEHVVMVHRTILGSMERFFGVLIEHYGGAFPTWLAPVQTIILPITDRQIDYARKINLDLAIANLRSEIDDRAETLSAKIRDAQMQKVPYMIVVGDKEQKDNIVAVRSRDRGDLGQMKLQKFIDDIKIEIDKKVLSSRGA